MPFVFRKTKINFDQDTQKDKPEDEENGENYFSHTGSSDSIEIIYTFKPKDKSK